MSTFLACPNCTSTEPQALGDGRYRCASCQALFEVRLLQTGDPEAVHMGVDAAYCAHCHAVVLSNAPFCHRCGAEVQAFSVTRACPICAKSIPVASAFCPYCHAQLDLPDKIGCPACGQHVAPTLSLCPACGADIEGLLAPLWLQIPIALRACPGCQRLVPVASSYCLYCQSPIVLPEDATHREWVDCPACWRRVVATGGICPYCGVDVRTFSGAPRAPALAADRQTAPSSQAETTGSRLFPIMLVMMLMCILATVGLAAWLVLSHIIGGG